jgi:microcystin-dependent protein
MSLLVWSNNASSTLASGIGPTDTTLVVQAGTGSEYPQVSAGQYAVLAVEDTSGDIEYMWLTGISGDSLTVARGKEGSTALSFASGSRVEVRVTAGVLATFLQKTGGDTLSGTTNLNGVLALGSGGSIQGGEFTGAIRSAPGVTAGQITVDGGQPMSGTATILTSSNVQNSLPAGTSLCMSGMVVYWYGSSGSVPAGWHVCDGSIVGGVQTPDLRDTFVFSLSVGSSYPASNSNPTFASGAASGFTLGSTDSYALQVADIPAHNHNLYGTFSTSGSVVSNTIAHNASASYSDNFGGPTELISQTGGGGGHSHGLTAAATAGAAHTHTATPPYVGLLAIMKL